MGRPKRTNQLGKRRVTLTLSTEAAKMLRDMADLRLVLPRDIAERAIRALYPVVMSEYRQWAVEQIAPVVEQRMLEDGLIDGVTSGLVN